MVGKKSHAASKISSSAALAISSTTHTAHNSSILQHLFLPSRYQLPLFASVIQGLDSQHLRIHDTTTARLQCEHAIQSKTTINCLDWGYHGKIHRHQDNKASGKKRKRRDQVNGNGSNSNPGDVVLAFGTSDSEINLFSTTSAKIVGVLKGAHTKGIRDFKFTDGGRSQEGWSVGGDGKLVQWNLLKGTSIRSLAIPGPNATSLSPLTSALICASHNAYFIDLDSGQSTSYMASINPIHKIICSSSNSSREFSFLTAAESDHFLTVFDKSSDKSIGTLRTENEAISLDLYSGDRSDNFHEEVNGQDIMQQSQEVLLAVNKDGTLEIFPSPFSFTSSSTSQESQSLKSRIMQRTRKASALVKIVRPDKAGTVVPLLDASFQGNDIVIAWTEGGVGLVFDSIPWREEGAGNLLIEGIREIVKVRGGSSIRAAVMNGVKDMGRNHVDQSHAVVMNGGDSKDEEMTMDQPDIIDGSSADSDSEFEEAIPHQQTTQVANSDVEMEDASEKDHGDGDIKKLRKCHQTQDALRETVDVEDPEGPQCADEPSFGELLRVNAPEPVDVSAAFPAPKEQALAPIGERLSNIPSGMSLGTVLTQSLRTNDLNLLETCFYVRDLPAVRATIERLDSSLATILLQKLAERLHGRPGRAGSLMVWIQWTLIAHGGYLASQPELMKKLASLYRVVKERANSLQSLLSLKGKLDMLEAQMNLRKSMQARSRSLNAPDEEQEEGVIYVEGQEQSSSKAGAVGFGSENFSKAYEDDDSDELESDGADGEVDDEEEEEDDDEEEEEEAAAAEERADEMPTTIPAKINDIEASWEVSDSEEAGLIDDEASSADQGSGDDTSSDILNHDSFDSAISSDDSPPPKKRISKSKVSNGIPSSSKRQPLKN